MALLHSSQRKDSANETNEIQRGPEQSLRALQNPDVQMMYPDFKAKCLPTVLSSPT